MVDFVVGFEYGMMMFDLICVVFNMLLIGLSLLSKVVMIGYFGGVIVINWVV